MEKIFFAGTHRVRPPEETLERITPLLLDFGITRLADVTGLDVIGIPVVMAVRPLATTLCVSQGKGASLLLAKVSGVMEAIELWHAENRVSAPSVVNAPAVEVQLGYSVVDLETQNSLLTEHTLLDWIPARTAAGNQETLVPRAAVHMGWAARDNWRNCLLSQNSNGLASGNTRAEAISHALYETIERDCTSEIGEVPVSQRTYIDPPTVDDQYSRELIDRIARANAWLEIVHIPNRWSLPCFVAYVWHEDLAACLGTGAGVHSDPAVALSRAITEAAQSRLTFISGTRDDLEQRIYQRSGSGVTRPFTPIEALVAWKEIAQQYPLRFTTDESEAAWLAENVMTRAGCEPMVVDLAEREEFAVVKVLCPGLRFISRHEIPRFEAEAMPR
jgi:ribosomal protein S12 methylthiotransferase accessory factor